MHLDFVFAPDRAPTPSCHASTLVEAQDGALLCAWFGGTDEGEPDVDVWLARHDGAGWSEPARVASGAGEPCWNPVLARVPGGPLLLFYKIGPDPTCWRGLVRRSLDDGRSWSPPEALPDGFLGPVRSRPVLLDGGLLCGSSVEAGGWRAHVEALHVDGRIRGRSAPFLDPHGLRAIQPSLVHHGGGRVQALCRTLRRVVAEAWSSDGGRRWTPLAPTGLVQPNSAVEALRLPDGRVLLAHNPGRDLRDVLALASSPDGRTWSLRPTLLESRPGGELSYPAALPTRDGRLHLTWTWDRRSIRHAVLDPTSIP